MNVGTQASKSCMNKNMVRPSALAWRSCRSSHLCWRGAQ